MKKFKAKVKKLVTKPRLFFKDALVKRIDFNTIEEKNKENIKKLTVEAVVKNVAKVNKPDVKKVKKTVTPSAQMLFSEKFQQLCDKKETFLFESYSGSKIGCNPYAIYQAMRKDESLKSAFVVWVITKNTVIPEDVKNDKNVHFVEYMSQEYAIALSEVKYLINNWIFPSFYIKSDFQYYINVWHGIPLKTMGLDIGPMGFENGPPIVNSGYIQRNFLQCSAIPIASKYAARAIVEAYGASSINLEKVEYIGSPRLDKTLTYEITQSLREKLSISDEKDILLYAPTWRGRFGAVSTEIDEQLEMVDLIQKQFSEQYHVVFSIHHSVKNKLEKMPINNNIHFIPEGFDINDALSEVSILISDYSSIIIDYLVLDRPIVLYIPDRSLYEGYHGLYVGLEELPVALAYDTEQLIKAVDEFKKPSSYFNYIDAVNKFIPKEDGHASERVINLLKEQILPVVSNQIKKKKILIYPGALFNNGITTSFLSLMDNIDHDLYDVTVLVDAGLIDKNDDIRYIYNNINDRCNFIFKVGSMALTSIEKNVYHKFINKPENSLSTDQLKYLQNSFFREGRRVLGDTYFDIAIDFSGYSPYWSAIIAFLDADIKIIYQHSDMLKEIYHVDPSKRRPRLLSVAQLYPYFTKIVSVSKEIKEVNYQGLKNYYSDYMQVVFARNTITPDKILAKSLEPLEFINTAAALMANNNNYYKFISIGRLSPEKNHDRLLEAFSLFQKKSNVNSVLFIVGDGSELAALKRKARKLKISDRVLFTGHLSNPYPLLKQCDCFILPSDYEGQGIVLLEALTLGIPCIATDIPAVKSILGNGEGFLAEPNPESFCEYMIKIAKGRKFKAFDAETYRNETMNEFYLNIGSNNTLL